MTEPWRLLVDTPHPAGEQMAYDARLACDAVPTVRFFQWQPPAVSLGWKQPAPAWLQSPAWRATGLAAVERPTGGGLAFHGSDVSVAVVVPRAFGCSPAVLMDAVCHSIVRLCDHYAVEADVLTEADGAGRVTYCLTEKSPYAVMIGQRKVAGLALRRYPESWLIQGSVLVRPLPAELMDGLPETVQAQLASRAVPLAEAAPMPVDEDAAIERWAESWPVWWEDAAGAMADAV